jgi:hypothetical protein
MYERMNQDDTYETIINEKGGNLNRLIRHPNEEKISFFEFITNIENDSA